MVRALRETYDPQVVSDHLKARGYGTALPSGADNLMALSQENKNEEE